jgi:hypothetical protein
MRFTALTIDFFAFALAIVLGWLLYIATADARKPDGVPKSSAAELYWFQSARSSAGGPCCSEADGFREGIVYPEQEGLSGHGHPPGMILREWHPNPDNPGGYDINILGKWFYVPNVNVVPGANPTGAAVAWVIFNTGYLSSSTYIRCFAPGNYYKWLGC